MASAKRFFYDAYIPLLHDEDIDLAFEREDVDRVVRLWEAGHCAKCIARTIDRSGDEIMILLISLGRDGTLPTDRPPNYKGFFGLCPLDCKGYKQDEDEGEASA